MAFLTLSLTRTLHCTDQPKDGWGKNKNKENKLANLVDAIAISKSETMNDSLTDPLTDRGRC